MGTSEELACFSQGCFDAYGTAGVGQRAMSSLKKRRLTSA